MLENVLVYYQHALDNEVHISLMGSNEFFVRAPIRGDEKKFGKDPIECMRVLRDIFEKKACESH